MSTRRVLATSLAAAAALGVGAAQARVAPRAHTASTCANLKAPKSFDAAIAAAFHTAHRGSHIKFIGPLKGESYFGQCGSTQWAVGTFTLPNGDATDQPETFRKLKGHPWHDRGDDGSICEIPHSLTTLWGLRPLQSGVCG